MTIFRRGDSVLVVRGIDTPVDMPFYRPLLAPVAHADYTVDVAEQLVRDELGVEVQGLRRLAVLENVFILEEEQRHEVVFLYEGALADAGLYGVDFVRRRGVPDAEPAVWMPMENFRSGFARLYPQGLLEILDGLV